MNCHFLTSFSFKGFGMFLYIKVFLLYALKQFLPLLLLLFYFAILMGGKLEIRLGRWLMG